jgi:xylan 1,4-beta-xylosidase
MYWPGTTEEYCKLFDYTEAAVHAVLPEARLSGPATTGPLPGSTAAQFLDDFLNHCANGTNFVSGNKGTRLDFITFHTKGGGFPFRLNAEKATPSVKHLVRQVETGCKIIAKYGYQDREVVLSEADPDGWAAGGRFDNKNMNFRNTEYYATYIASSYNQIKKLAESLQMDVRPLAWAFMFVAERCFEGTRTFSTQGIDKASFNLFKMYAKLGTEEIAMCCGGERDILQDEDDFSTGQPPQVTGIAAKDGNGGVQVLVCSHHDDWDVKTDSRVSLGVTGLDGQCFYEVTHYRIDSSHSNAYSQWMAEGQPDYPSPEQYARIKGADGLEIYELFQHKKAVEGRLVFDFIMPAHGVSLFTLVKQGESK